MKRLGLIAGCGDFPLLFARAAKEKGISLTCVAIKDEASPRLETLVDKIHWISFGEVKKVIDIFKKENIKTAVMLGGITKTKFFKGTPRVDEGGEAVLKFARDKKDITLFRAAAMFLKLNGITLKSALICLKENLAKKGCLTKRAPSEKELSDVRFGFKIARRLAALDVGQTIVVKDKAVLAVEAIEGTDEAIKRGGSLGNGDVVVVKAARPNQDMRFDIPVIGLNTMNSLKEAKATCLAIEKSKTLIINKEELVRSANEAGISIVVI